MMLPKTKEATSWTNYPEPSTLNKNVAIGNSTSTFDAQLLRELIFALRGLT
jgi:hypothetical protein